MTVRRVVPDLTSQSLEASTDFYGEVFGLQPAMDHGWIVTLADPERPEVQVSIPAPFGRTVGREDIRCNGGTAGSLTNLRVSLMTHDETAPVVPDASIQVDDVDACHATAVELGAEIVHPLTDESWGVRRFFVRDPDGHVINVLSHL